MGGRTDKKLSSFENPTYDAESLRSAGRNIKVPFQLPLKVRGVEEKLICHEILRNLPGKRLVCFGKIEENDFVVAKIFLDRSRGRRHFHRELRGVRALEAACIPTPKLLCQGTLVDGRTHFLLTRKIEGAKDLKQHLCDHPSGSNLMDSLTAVVVAIATLHDKGLSQRDIHPGNFLLKNELVHIIDGADVRQHRSVPLSARPSIDNLGFFLSQFQSQSEAHFRELMAIYCRHRNWFLTPGLEKKVLKAIRRCIWQREKKFLSKTLRSSTAFVAVRTWKHRSVCKRDWYCPSMQRLIATPEAAIADGTILKAGNTATVAKVDLQGRSIVVKRYNIKNGLHAFSRAFRSTRAIISWRNANRLTLHKISTPEPIAIIEKRWGPVRRQSYFICRYIPGEPISDAIKKRREDSVQPMQYLEGLLKLLKQLHKHRLSHGDLKASNLILYKGRLQIIDLDGMKKYLCLPLFERAFHRDMHRLVRNWEHDSIFTNILSNHIRHFLSDFDSDV